MKHALIALVALLSITAGFAQDYPARPVTVIVPFYGQRKRRHRAHRA